MADGQLQKALSEKVCATSFNDLINPASTFSSYVLKSVAVHSTTMRSSAIKEGICGAFLS